MRPQISHITIPKSGDLSAVVGIKGAAHITAIATIPTSCALDLEGSWDSTSAHFAPVFVRGGASLWSWSIGSGTGAIDICDVVQGCAYIRFGSGVAMTAVASIAIIAKFNGGK